MVGKGSPVLEFAAVARYGNDSGSFGNVNCNADAIQRCGGNLRIPPPIVFMATMLSGAPVAAGTVSVPVPSLIVVPGQVRCSSIEPPFDQTGGYLLRLDRSPNGDALARVSLDYGHDDAPPRFALEGGEVRATFAERPPDVPTQKAACPPNEAREFFSTLPGRNKEAPRALLADRVVLSQKLGTASAEVAQIYSCGGSVAEEGRRAWREERPMSFEWLDERTVKAVLWWNSRGSRLITPTVHLSGRSLKLGFEESEAPVAVACSVFFRLTYLVRGLEPGTQVEAGGIAWYQWNSRIEWWAKIAGVTLLALGGVGLIWRRLRRRNSPAAD